MKSLGFAKVLYTPLVTDSRHAEPTYVTTWPRDGLPRHSACCWALDRLKRGFQPTQRTQRNERKQRKKCNECNSRTKRKLQPTGTELSSFQLNSSF